MKTFEEAVKDFVKFLDYEIPLESGTYNKFCPKCYYRNGHPMQWCRECGSKTAKYTEQSIRPSWKSFITTARSLIASRKRVEEFVHVFSKQVDFEFVWWNRSPNCTTGLFADDILFACGISVTDGFKATGIFADGTLQEVNGKTRKECIDLLGKDCIMCVFLQDSYGDRLYQIDIEYMCKELDYRLKERSRKIQWYAVNKG